MDNDTLFFIALLPDGRIQQEVTDFKKICARQFRASHALKSPPHITLVPPFRWQLQRLPALDKALQDFTAGRPAFEVGLHGFGCFKPRVIFVDVVDNQQLTYLQASLCSHLQQSIQWADERGLRFHPHMTIAHRDLKPTQFDKAWSYFSPLTYQRSFVADRLSLLEHIDHRWLVREEYCFD